MLARVISSHQAGLHSPSDAIDGPNTENSILEKMQMPSRPSTPQREGGKDIRMNLSYDPRLLDKQAPLDILVLIGERMGLSHIVRRNFRCAF
jgi:hypothetical protein